MDVSDDEDGAASHEQDAEAGPGTSSLWSQFQVSFYPSLPFLFLSLPSFPLPPCSRAFSLDVIPDPPDIAVDGCGTSGLVLMSRSACRPGEGGRDGAAEGGGSRRGYA